ncbi:hypothetical protein WH47_06137 [Habropoda laboriosa]|uniref:Retrotransposon gag domain-containing protein n=1 Tax=Habropoda laboriosa TaxID=597456 RepID=A0A0L7RK20_9HYME|nr:hypothetical protein WH47_06137 [Habropoda laboriosa]
METRAKKHPENPEDPRRLERECELLMQERDAAIAQLVAARKESNSPQSIHDNTPVDSFTLKEALATIPTFNGTESVLTFTRACTRARDLVPPSAEATLTRLITTHLRGRAATAVEDERYINIADLCTRLKKVFGPQKTVDHYRGDMANIYMREEEHILDYIARVKDIRNAIIDCDASTIAEIDNLTVDCFTRGIIPQLRSGLRPLLRSTLSQVFDEAIEL